MPRKVRRQPKSTPEDQALLAFTNQAQALAEAGLATQHAADVDFTPQEREALATLDLSGPLHAELRRSGACRLSLGDVVDLLAGMARACSAEPSSPAVAFGMFTALERLLLVADEPVKMPQTSRKARNAKALMAAFAKPAAEPAAPKGRRGRQPTGKQPTGALYQFKIVLRGLKPEIWRRIQVEDCTLDALHGHIQTAMGWHNSHLHQFEIRGDRFVNLSHLPDDGWGPPANDTRETLLSEVVPPYAPKKRVVFKYEYDFGDSWTHEIRLERTPRRDPAARYPRCIEGAGACPPEDCGGVWGYAELLDTLSDPEHEQHEELMEWAGGPIDADAFDARKATQRMSDGIIDIL